MVTAAWAVGFLNLLPNSLFTYSLHFCGPRVIPHFCCGLPSLFPLSCTDPTANEALLAGSCALLGSVTFSLILFSCSRVISAIIWGSRQSLLYMFLQVSHCRYIYWCTPAHKYQIQLVTLWAQTKWPMSSTQFSSQC